MSGQGTTQLDHGNLMWLVSDEEKMDADQLKLRLGVLKRAVKQNQKEIEQLTESVRTKDELLRQKEDEVLQSGIHVTDFSR